MKWSELPQDAQNASLQRAAARHEDRLMTEEQSDNIAGRVTFADIADFAIGRTARVSRAQLVFAMRTNASFQPVFDMLIAEHSRLEIPMAAAASSGRVTLRREIDSGVELHIVQSEAEPNTYFVRLIAPEAMRPLRRLVIKTSDALEVLILDDDQEDDLVEALVDHDSPELRALQTPDAQIWLS